MTAVPRPCQVLAMGSGSSAGPDGSGLVGVGSASFAEGAAAVRTGPPPSSQPFEQTTHVTLQITTDSATHQPGLYLKYQETFPTAEAARRYHDRVQDWLATRPDPADEAPAPVIVDQPRSLHEILEFARDDERYSRPVTVARPFDWARE